MSHFPEPEPGPEFEPFALFREHYGFVPNLFRAQTLLPRALEAEAAIARSVLLTDHGLTRVQKELVLLVVAAHYRNPYCATSHAGALEGLGVPEETIAAAARDYHVAGLPPEDVGLIDFCLKLATTPTWVGRGDFAALRGHGFGDEQILDAVLISGLTRFLCTLSTGVGAEPDGAPFELPPGRPSPPRPASGTDVSSGGFPASAPSSVADVPCLAFFKERFGFVPNLYKAQSPRPDALEAQAKAFGNILLTDDVLSRTQKEAILLVISAANRNTYHVAVHGEMLRALGVSEETSDRIAIDHHSAGLPAADVALLDAALLLAREPQRFGPAEVAALRGHGFGDEQILEAIVMAAVTQFLNTLQMGLGTVPDFPARLEFPREIDENAPFAAPEKKPNLADAAAHPTFVGSSDPDAEIVARVRGGDVDAFEILVRRHGGRILRTLRGITGESADAEDALQSAFLRAFERIAEFHGSSLFGTWLTRIAINEGLQKVRARRPAESLDAGEDDTFRPRLILPWHETPESLYSEAQRKELVERAVAGLPEKYRVAVVLRDMEQLTTEEAAAALHLPIPTLKTRVLRGRLMLREALAPHFVARRRGAGA